jgi:hypothetical protein
MHTLHTVVYDSFPVVTCVFRYSSMGFLCVYSTKQKNVYDCCVHSQGSGIPTYTAGEEKIVDKAEIGRWLCFGFWPFMAAAAAAVGERAL